MRDEYSPQLPSADERSTDQRNADESDSSRNNAARADSAGRNAERWVPLAYDLEQNGDASSEYRGEVF